MDSARAGDAGLLTSTSPAVKPNPKPLQELAVQPSESRAPSAVIGDTPRKYARDVRAVGQIGALPTLLAVLCETTGMRFAAVARVTEHTWTACAVRDEIDFGLKVGGQLADESTLCIESKRALTPIVIEHASHDPQYREHHTPRAYNIESYISVPIVLASGRYFRQSVSDRIPPGEGLRSREIIGMFTQFAALIAMQLDSEMAREREQKCVAGRAHRGDLRDQFIAISGPRFTQPAAGHLRHQ